MPVQTRFHIRRKFFVLAVCITISTIVWLLNDLNKVQTTTVQIPVSFSGLPYDMVPTNSLPNTMEATIEATGFTLLWRQFISKKRIVDISLRLEQGVLVPGKNYLFNTNYYIEDISRSLSSYTKIKRLFPDTFSIRFEKKFVKKVPIRLCTDFQYEKEFYQSANILLEPDSVIISGVKEKVIAIDSVCTKLLKLKNLKKTYDGKIELENINGISYSIQQLKVKLPIEQFTQKQISLKITATSVPSNNELNPIPDMALLNLLVPISLFNSISASQFIVSASFPVSNKKMNKILLTVVQKPEYVKVISIVPPSVEYIIKSKE